jgi:hypothetical protein
MHNCLSTILHCDSSSYHPKSGKSTSPIYSTYYTQAPVPLRLEPGLINTMQVQSNSIVPSINTRHKSSSIRVKNLLIPMRSINNGTHSREINYTIHPSANILSKSPHSPSYSLPSLFQPQAQPPSLPIFLPISPAPSIHNL